MGAILSKQRKTVAVCGATGQQGGATVKALVKLGRYTIRAITRDPTSAKAQALAAMPGVQVVQADFDDLASMEKAFNGCDAVFAVTDFWKACGLDPVKELQQGKNLVDAAKAAQVKHFVWSTLEDTRPLVGDSLQPVNGDYKVPHFDAKGEIEAYASAKLQGVFTFVVTSVFYENILPGGGMGPSKQPDGSFSLFIPSGDCKLAWCATEDIGGVAAAVIAAGPKKYGGKTVPVAGEVVTTAEVAAILSKVSGKNVVAVTPPPEEWAKAVMGFGVPELAAKDLANMFVYYQKANEHFLSLRSLKDTKKIYPDTQSMESFFMKHKEALMTVFE